MASKINPAKQVEEPYIEPKRQSYQRPKYALLGHYAASIISIASFIGTMCSLRFSEREKLFFYLSIISSIFIGVIESRVFFYVFRFFPTFIHSLFNMFDNLFIRGILYFVFSIPFLFICSTLTFGILLVLTGILFIIAFIRSERVYITDLFMKNNKIKDALKRAARSKTAFLNKTNYTNNIHNKGYDPMSIQLINMSNNGLNVNKSYEEDDIRGKGKGVSFTKDDDDDDIEELPPSRRNKILSLG